MKNNCHFDIYFIFLQSLFLLQMDVMNKIDGLTGILLCGGKSSRMGKEKGVCKLHNKSLIEYGVGALGKVIENIILGTDKSEFEYLGYPMVKDEFVGIGPLSGIYSCLKASTTDDNFILSCDMPLVTEELIRFIINNKEKYDAVIPMFNNFPEPLCAYYHKNIVPEIEKSIEDGVYKIQEVAKGLNTKYLNIDPSVDFFDDHLFYNINTPDELNYIEKLKTTR